MNIQRFMIALLLVTLSACSSMEPAPSPTPITVEPVQNGDAGHTVLRFEFPFEPAPPGYLVDVKSTVLTANLMCVLQPGKTTGEVMELNQNTKDTKTWGICDTSSMTLDVLIADQITVTVILGGFPLVDEVTKSPDALTQQQAEYYFESGLK